MARIEEEQVQEDTEFLEETEYLEEEQVEEAEGEEAAAEVVDASVASLKEVQDQDFVEVRLPSDVVAELQEAWSTFIASLGSREATGEAIYAALFDSAPSLQSLFKTPRSVMAMRFMNGFNSIISAASSPSALKTYTETLGFQHLDFEVTIPRVVIFRDALIDLFDMEIGARFTSKAKLGFLALLNYVGGAFIYIKREYAGRIKIINSSWRTANNKAADFMEEAEGEEGEGGEGGESKEVAEGEESKQEAMETNNARASGDARASGEANNGKNGMKVPTTFNEMFMFNGAVMGYGSSLWMSLVLEQFENMVLNVSNSYRLQEECDVLSLVLAKYKGVINLSEFKAVMLASLRSLCPKDWDSSHEVAWGWLWENVERMLKNLMGKPAQQERALECLIMSLTEEAQNYLRREQYKRFFALAPAGQDYFKQSTTRQYWIVDKILEMTLEMYREPKKMVEDLSALGLRHVGYSIPTEFFAPFVSGAVEVVREITADEEAEGAFRWSLTLISKILVRTVLEGSTIVMQAINTNLEKALKKAIAVAPRGKRSTELLNITVGTQSISPLYWSIESGSLICAKAMLQDLLTIRADRDNYYYGCDDMFNRHPEIIQRLSADASVLLPDLLDGLVWRSRVAVNGQRRVNYYVKHLLQDAEGGFNQALEWLVVGKDPKIICHPAVVLFSDMIWSRLANRFLFLGRCYFLFTLCVFITSQAILTHLKEGGDSMPVRVAIFVCRVIIYLGSMGQLFLQQIKKLVTDIKEGAIVRLFGYIPFPSYLLSAQNLGSFGLLVCLLVMCTQEPIYWCIDEEPLFTQKCAEGNSHKEAYTTLSMICMLLYFALLIDLTIFSMRISAFVLVCAKVLSELGLFLGALIFLIVSFSCSISALAHEQKDFKDIPKGALSLLEITLGMFPSDNFYFIQQEATVFMAVALFILVAIVFLLNLLVAQLNGAYQLVYEDMVGYARLNRGNVIVTTVEGLSARRWARFLSGLRLDERLEFNEGDIGLAGGIQVTEPSNANPITVDMIRRFGGSTSPAMPWPEEEGTDEDDKLERLEKVILRATKKMGNDGGSKKKGGSSSMGQSSGSGSRGGGSNVGSGDGLDDE